MNVYFISGMCVNCKVFDNLILPPGYNKRYIEWYDPADDETLEEYTRTMAENIDLSEPFILVGYSFGGAIMQEMNKFLIPKTNILISSMKSEAEIPRLFRLAHKTNMTDRIPKRLYAVNNTVKKLFTRIIYDMPIDDIEIYVTHTSPAYMKWSVYQITNWLPTVKCLRLFHIHGTKDQIFPYAQIENPITLEDGDHLMVLNKSEEVSAILNRIFLTATN